MLCWRYYAALEHAAEPLLVCIAARVRQTGFRLAALGPRAILGENREGKLRGEALIERWRFRKFHARCDPRPPAR